MSRLTDQPPAWAGAYVGLLFKDRGRDQRGVDCWGLLSLVYAERLGILLPDLAYRGVDQIEDVAQEVGHQLADGGDWRPIPVDQLARADAVLFRPGGKRPWHVGIVVGRNKFLHAQLGSDSCIERLDSPLWERRREGFFRYAGLVRLAARLKPFSLDRLDTTLPAGGTILDLLAAAGVQALPSLRVLVGGGEVPFSHWGAVRPKPGRMVTVVAVPAGGGGGGKTAGRVILTIAVIAAAAIAGPEIAGGLGFTSAAGYSTAAIGVVSGLGAAAVTLAGTLLINALIPLPSSKLSTSTANSLTNGTNQADPWGPVPVNFGFNRIAPRYAALPYTEVVGDDQYLRMAFVVSKGRQEISDIRIGDTPIDQFEGVQYEVRDGSLDNAPLTLYTNAVFEEALSILVANSAGWISHTTGLNADQISLDLTWPQGASILGGDGSRGVRTVVVEVQYAPAGTGLWTAVNGDSPGFVGGMDFLFRQPEQVFGGTGTFFGEVAWGLGFPGTKPAYLPATQYSWEASGWIYAPSSGTYTFGVDGSDAVELSIGDSVTVAWYGTHGTSTGGLPDYTAHSAPRFMVRGWHPIRIRMGARSTAGAVAIGWTGPFFGWQTIPAASLSVQASGGSSSVGKLIYRWFTPADAYVTSSLFLQTNSTDLARRNLAWAVPRGQYDVRVRRATADSTSPSIVDQVYWTALRTITIGAATDVFGDPVREAGVAKIAVRIKATNQLNGAVSTLNCMARSILPDWNPDTGAWEERTTNTPASCYRAVLQGPGIATPLDDSRIHITDLQELSEASRLGGFAFNAVFEDKGTVFQRLATIAAAAKCAYGMRDGKYTMVADTPQTVAVQHITPRNSWGYQGSKAFADLPHALRVQFVNEAAAYQQDERIVLDDGYSIDGMDAFGNPAPLLPEASLFESVQLAGVTSPTQVFKLARYFIAVGRLRPEVHMVSMDFEHLASTRGDLVYLTHDVPLFGGGYGRITGLVKDAGDNLLGIELDDIAVMDPGVDYVVRVRLSDGTSFLRPVVTVEGDNRTLTFASLISPADARPDVGDLWMFGQAGLESRPCIIKSIAIEKDLSARLTLIDHAPAVHSADTGPIPPYDAGISTLPNYQNRPETPVIESIRSDDLVMIIGNDGTLIPRMLIALRPQSGTRPLANAAQVRLRPRPPAPADPTGPWTWLPLIPLEGNLVSVVPVVEGVTYDIMLRTVTAIGQVSDWVSAVHTVIGKAAPPPDVISFDVVRLSDGTRQYSWDLGVEPPDIAGVHIRYGPPGYTWDIMTPLHTGELQSTPAELNEPPEGIWRFAIRAVDTSGNESVDPLYIDRALGPARLEGVAFESDEGFDGWLGTRTHCHITSEGTLEADDQATWDTLAALGAATWDQWTRWVFAPFSPILYESEVLDAGFLFTWSPDAIAVGEGTVQTEVSWSTDGVTYTPYVDVVDARGQVVTARYLKARVTVSSNSLVAVAVIRSLTVYMRAAAVIAEINDLDTSTLDGPHTIGVGDIRLPVPQGRFNLIRHISMNFNGMGAGWSWELVDRDTLLGPRVRLYNSLHQPQHALVDAVIRGL